MQRVLLALVVVVAAACAPKPSAEPLPPPGLAGAPSTGAKTPISADAAMPPGHPDIGGHQAGGDDGAPLPTKGAPLPNFGMPSGDTGGGAPGGGMGGNVVFTGKVLEKVDVPSYTYMRIQTGGAEEWVAVSTMSVNVGDTVTINQQIVMNNFASKSLNRTFEKLIMGTAMVGG